jgi:hypothetical protein
MQEQDAQHQVDPPGKESEDPQSHGNDLKGLSDDEDGPFAEDVGGVARVAREEKEGEDEHGTHQGELAAPPASTGRHVNCEHGDDDLVDVVVESSQELRPEEGLEANRF